MGFSFYQGHDRANDDMLAGGGGSNGSMDRRKGYLGDGEGYEDEDGNIQRIGSGGINTEAPEDWDQGGGGEQVVNGWKQGGTSAWDKSVDRYRGIGEAAQGRAALTLDRGREGESRGLQLSALDLLRKQADGSAASSAAILSQRANQGAAQQIGAAGLRKGGPGAAIAAQGLATPGAAGQAMNANVQGANDRAGEVSRGQGSFAGGATAMQGQDTSAAFANAQLEARQRELNEAKQQRYERMGFDTRTTQLQAGVDSEKARHLNQLSINQAKDARRDADSARTEGNVNAGVSMIMGAASGSDPRTKQNVVPMGSLASLVRSRGGR